MSISHAFEPHHSLIRALASTSDGRAFLSEAGGRLLYWDAGSGLCFQSVEIPECGWSAKPTICCAPRGPLMAIRLPHQVQIWAYKEARLLTTLEVEGVECSAIAFSPDGHYIAAALSDRLVRIWEAAEGRCALTLKGHRRDILDVTFSADGRRLATGSKDKTARVWDLVGGRALKIFEHARAVTSVAFSPDGARLATASARARVWSIDSGKPLLERGDGRRYFKRVAWAPSGAHLVTLSSESHLQVWASGGGKSVARRSAVAAFDFGPDDALLVVGGDGAERWHRGAWRALSPDAHWAVSAAPTGRVAYSLSGGPPRISGIDPPTRVPRGSPDDVGIDEEGISLIYTSGLQEAPSHKRVAWETGRLTLTPLDFNERLRIQAGGRASARRAAGGPDPLRAPDLERLLEEGDPCSAVQLSPDGRLAVVIRDQRSITLWDLDRRERRWSTPTPNLELPTALQGLGAEARRAHRVEVGAVVFSPDQSEFSLVGTPDLWRFKTGVDPAPTHVLRAGGSRLRYHPDGSCLLVLSKAAQVFDGRRRIGILEGLDDAHDARFCGGGAGLITASPGGTLRLWETKGWSRVYTIPPRGIQSPNGSQLSPSGRRLISWERHRRLSLQSTAGGAALATVRLPGVLHAWFLDDARVVASSRETLWFFGEGLDLRGQLHLHEDIWQAGDAYFSRAPLPVCEGGWPLAFDDPRRLAYHQARCDWGEIRRRLWGNPDTCRV